MQERLDLKAIWESCMPLFQEYLHKESTLESQIQELCSSDIPIGKEEYALGSRYMHRGYYCPSPIYDKLVGNARRGRIAKRITKTTRPTNRYEFDIEGKLRLVETINRNGHNETEFVFYEEGVVFGLTYDGHDLLSKLSIEQYTEGMITSYLRVICDKNGPNRSYRARSMSYECYRYNADHMDADVYFDLMEYNGFLFGVHGQGRFRAVEPQEWEVMDWQFVK